MGVTEAASHFFFKHTIPFLLSPPPETFLGLTGLQTVFLEGSLVIQTSSVCDPLARSPSEGGMSSGTFWVLQASCWHRVWGAKSLCGLRAFPYELTLPYVGYLPYTPL